MQRGRKSAEASLIAGNLVALGIDPPPPPIDPPAGLRPAERKLFREIIAASVAGHFAPIDTPLLVSFVQVTVLARAAARKRDIDVLDKLVRLQASLAVKLRLAVSARTDPKTLSRAQVPSGPKPWR